MKTLEILLEEDASGMVRPVELATDAPIAALLPALVSELKLPQTDIFGNPLFYALTYPAARKILPEERTLQEAGIPAGAVLRLDSVVVPASAASISKPPVTPMSRSSQVAPLIPPTPDPFLPGDSDFHASPTLVDNSGYSSTTIPQKPISTLQPLAELDAVKSFPGVEIQKAPKKKRSVSRRGFFAVAAAVVGAGMAGGAYAAYRSFMHFNVTAPITSMATHQPNQNNQQLPQQKPAMLQAKMRFQFAGHTQPVRSLSWQSNGAMLASGGLDNQLLAWNAANGNIQFMHQFANPVRGIAWSPDNQRLLMGSGTQVAVLNGQTGAMLLQANKQHTGTVNSVAWSKQNPQLVVSAGADMKAIVWNPINLVVQTTFLKHNTAINIAGIASDGQTISTASAGGVVRVWNGTNAQEVHGFFQDMQQPAQALAWSPQGNQLAIGEDDGIVRIWNGLTCQQTGNNGGCVDMPKKLQTQGKAVRSVAWSSDGELLAAGTEDGQLIIWQPGQSQNPMFKQQFQGVVRLVSWSPVARQLAVATGNFITIWDIN